MNLGHMWDYVSIPRSLLERIRRHLSKNGFSNIRSRKLLRCWVYSAITQMIVLESEGPMCLHPADYESIPDTDEEIISLLSDDDHNPSGEPY